MKRVIQVLLCSALAAAVLAPHAQAREGRLDAAFGDRGRVALDGVAYSLMVVGRDGSPVLMSRKRVVRLTRNGDLDRRFGGDGSLRIPVRAAGWSFESVDVALDSRGRILLFGAAYPRRHGVIKVGPNSERVRISRGAVLRLQSDDGRLDSSFGQAGAVVSDFGVRSEIPELRERSEPTTGIAAGAVDSRDRLLLAVGAVEGFSPCNGHSFLARRPSAIARLTPSGLPDPEFGEGDGLSPALPEFDGDPLVSLAMTAADQPLLGGALSTGCPVGASVVRLSEQGTPLPGYGTDGRQNFRKFWIAAFTPDGGAILHRRLSGTEIVRRVTPQGLIDRTFGVDGRVSLKMPPGTNRVLRPAEVDSEGRILLVGSYSLPTSGLQKKRAFIVVQRLLASGQPDLRFGRRSRMTVPIPEAQILGFNQVALDRQGRLLVSSEVTRLDLNRTGEGVILRFLLDE